MAKDASTREREDYSAWEAPIFEAWRDAGVFERTPGFGEKASVPYTIVIPPPNITGVLHMGHALNDTIQDACVRHARMQGHPTRWILGTDHAGIATQTKVDKHLQSQGIDRHEIGREAFIEECQKWRDEYGTTIVNQIKAMGCSCDYENEQFTMSPEFSLAVRKVFVQWYEDGIIYKGRRIVNWCPHCTTAIADDEAEYENEASHLWHLRYPLSEPVEGFDGEYLVVATTRPETMLGDTGVAVSPSDERYSMLVGKTVRLPLVDREIPIFEDFHVDPEFGTGAVKVTPAHDPNDFAMGQAHGLEQINIFDETATVVDGYGEFSGMSRDEAREAVVARLEEQGLLDHVDDLEHSVMHCYRCHTTLESWLSEQWFVGVEKLKGAAQKAVEDGSVRFFPERWSQVYLDWLDNLKDWCISRQLWWGHRIPMYYCDACGWQGASVEDIERCPECDAHVWQDEDVLDTWFSSQLWPFATQGWGVEGSDALELVEYYPTQMLSTARDIMGLWVARMVMSSEYFMGTHPFRDVIIHPTVMGADGKPMSKSRGNGVDPVRLMEDYGADGMRFGLIGQVTGSQSIRFDVQRIEAARNFANKIRNAARFVEMNLDGFEPGEPEAKDISDRWMLSRLYELVRTVDACYEDYSFSDMAAALHSFFWNELCDWYIEFSKARLADGHDPEDRRACQRNLVFILDAALRLLHPIMPFITEDIHSRMQARIASEAGADPVNPSASHARMLALSAWPDASELARWKDIDAEDAIELVCGIVGAVRSARSRYALSPKTLLDVSIKAPASTVEAIEAQMPLISALGRVGEYEIGEDVEQPSESVASVVSDAEVYVRLAGLVDFDEERRRIKKRLAVLEKDAGKLERKLSNPGFLSKAAPEIVEKDKSKLEATKKEIALLEEQSKALG